LAAPVVVGNHRQRRRPPAVEILVKLILGGLVVGVGVHVVMKPCSIPTASFITLARGARQLLVQEALETTR